MMQKTTQNYSFSFRGRGHEVFSNFEAWANERISLLPDGENYCCINGHLTGTRGVRTEFRFTKRTDAFRGDVPMPGRGLVDPESGALTLGVLDHFSFQPDEMNIRTTWAPVDANSNLSGIVMEGRRGLSSNIPATVVRLLDQIPDFVRAG